MLVLVSDTVSSHHSSTVAIHDAFYLEFDNKYQVFVKDLGKEYGEWPLNDMERSYKFMVKHVQLWKVAFYGTSPHWVHCLYLAAIAAIYTKKVAVGLIKYKSDIIISVHPLMQHISLWVLKWQSLQQRVPFVTVITNLNTCHPIWFHNGVNRCYYPYEKVAERALLEGLGHSQICIFKLLIRPSFCHTEVLRKEPEMNPHLPVVFLMGGGEGVGLIKKTAKALDEALYDRELSKTIGQIVIIYGCNYTL